MLSGLSFRLDFVFSISLLLILSEFSLTYFHLAEATLVPRAISKKLKMSFSSYSCSELTCWSQG